MDSRELGEELVFSCVQIVSQLHQHVKARTVGGRMNRSDFTSSAG